MKTRPIIVSNLNDIEWISSKTTQLSEEAEFRISDTKGLTVKSTSMLGMLSLDLSAPLEVACSDLVLLNSVCDCYVDYKHCH